MNTTSFSFTDRATYLVWRAAWRETYQQTSTEIRALRRAFKQSQRDNDIAQQIRTLSELEQRQYAARSALHTRLNAKVRAGQLYAQEKAVTNAA